MRISLKDDQSTADSPINNQLRYFLPIIYKDFPPFNPKNMKYKIYCWFLTDEKEYNCIGIDSDSCLFEDVRAALRNLYHSGIYDLKYNVYAQLHKLNKSIINGLMLNHRNISLRHDNIDDEYCIRRNAIGVNDT